MIWAICSLSALCVALVGVLAHERSRHRRERAEISAEAHARERDLLATFAKERAALLDRIMSRDYREYAAYNPPERPSKREPSDEERQRLEAQQAVDLAGTIQ